MKKILNHLFDNRSFSREEAQQILMAMVRGEFNTSQIAAFMTAYCMRNITVDELQGFRDAMLALCVKVDLKDFELIDVCGTGGDGKDTFNISTLASFVVAGTGQAVAKHGNYGVSSGCGSSNVMEYLGYKFTDNQEVLKRSLHAANICFIHAPLFNPAMKNVAPIRKDLALKTFFNMLGPMVNPAQPKYQMVGVFSLELARLYAYLYQGGDKVYSILHAVDGYDEISLTGDVKLFNNHSESLLTVEDLGLKPLTPQSIQGGSTVPESADIFIKVLEAQGSSAQNQVVLANAAMALQTIQADKSFQDCYAQAEDSLMSLKALNSFKKLIDVA